MTLPVSLTDAPARVLVVSPSFALRNSFICALEDDGCPTVEAASVDEALWHLVSACDVGPIDLILADPGTPGLASVLLELRAAEDAPTLLLLGPTDDAALAGVAAVRDAGDIEVVRAAVERLARS